MERDKLLQSRGEDESEHQPTLHEARRRLSLREWISSKVKSILLALLVMSCAVNIIQSAYIIASHKSSMHDWSTCGECMQRILDLLKIPPGEH
jgi:hypothetical protein